MARCRRIITTVILLLLGFLSAPSVQAQFGGIVFDPKNYVQNFYTAIRNHTQMIQQANQLRNEARMLINQAKHLSKLDVNTANELNRLLSEIADLNTQAENVAYEVERTRQLVREHYPESYANLTEDEFLIRADEQWDMSRMAYNDAMIMQSQMVESLTSDRQLLTHLMNKSHGAVGDLQASQATNQLIALLIKQSMQAQQMMVTQARADSVDRARQLAIEKESRERLKNFVGTSTAYTGGR